jgi:hypothetical protein
MRDPNQAFSEMLEQLEAAELIRKMRDMGIRGRVIANALGVSEAAVCKWRYGVRIPNPESARMIKALWSRFASPRSLETDGARGPGKGHALESPQSGSNSHATYSD